MNDFFFSFFSFLENIVLLFTSKLNNLFILIISFLELVEEFGSFLNLLDDLVSEKLPKEQYKH